LLFNKNDGMFGTLLKKKIDAEKLANVFVNSIIEITDNSFDTIKEFIEDDPAFVLAPSINKASAEKFLLIVTAGNLNYLSNHFEVQESLEIRNHIIRKFANIYDVEQKKMEELLEQTSSFISKVNHPSKNMLYGMSKALFHELDLNQYQEDYFKNMRTPNPLFLKRMDEIMSNFLWDWEQFFRKYKFQMN